MCGITGILGYGASAPNVDPKEVLRIRDHMAPRGPDGCGLWQDKHANLVLGHRRLAIIDLTDGGHQPMHSASGRYHITFNGEIYNYPQLRDELERSGRRFVSNSDTEVLLHLFELKGADMTAELRGMFAFAIWDSETRELFLARDPYGIKPLYYADDGHTFRFASQVKAILAGGGVSREPDPAGVVGFYLWGSVPEPFTLFSSIRSVPAGSSLRVTRAGAHPPVRYAKLSDLFSKSGPSMTEPELNLAVRNAALDSVKAHLLADVEVGLFLSSGIDSGALLGLMRDAGAEKIRTITLAFSEYRNMPDDEAPLAARVAQAYGADHSTRYVTETEFLGDVERILESMDQPTIDGVNTWFVAKAAKEIGLKVALSGVGADEILAGYPSFTSVPKMVKATQRANHIPGLSTALRKASIAFGFSKRRPKLPDAFLHGGSFQGAYLIFRGLYTPSELTSVLADEDFRMRGLDELNPFVSTDRDNAPVPASPIAHVGLLESTNYLRNQLLRDTDWTGMAHGLEIRTPFVDIELARRIGLLLPSFRNGLGKRALGLSSTRPLTSELLSRPKTGFGVPIANWLSHLHGQHVEAGTSRGRASRDWARHIMGSKHFA